MIPRDRTAHRARSMGSLILGVLSMAWFSTAAAAELKLGDPAPLFEAQTHEGQPFRLEDRRGKGWTVLYFYPKADTPGCTKQACAFRDANRVIRELGAEIYGISADEVADQAGFHAKYHLTFTLLADPEAKVVSQWGAKLPLIKLAKRWTFLLDPDLRVRWLDRDVDPMLDAQHVAEELRKLQAADAAAAPPAAPTPAAP